MLILQYKVSFTYDRLGRCFRFVYVYACIVAFLSCYRFLVNKDLYRPKRYRYKSPDAKHVYNYSKLIT